jgi:anaerobic magnesium-protoporphyrin IX monomethyl ester cyclase
MKKLKVLLVTPNLKGIKDGLNRIQPPLGLMLIAQTLMNEGHEVKIHDFALEGWENRSDLDLKNNLVLIGQSDKEVADVISNFAPDVLGISVLFQNLIEHAQHVAKIAKSINKKIQVFVGGNCISNAVVDYKFAIADKKSNLPDYIPYLEDKNFDCAIAGEGEVAVKQFINALASDSDISKVPGLVKKIGEKKYIINPTARIHFMDMLPRPARHLVNMEKYFKIGNFHSSKSRSKRVLNVMCSRGCPEKCTFCTTPAMWGQLTRWRSISHIMEEIKNDVRDYKIGEIQFDDDTLTVNKKMLFALCAELEKVGVPWCTPNGTKVNYHLKEQYDMYKAMADSGCYQLTLACESGVQRVLDKIINKRLPLETVKPAIEKAKRAGLLVHTFWIIGYPGETYDEIQQTIDFAMGCGADSFTFSVLTPLSGTPVYRQTLKENLWWDGKENQNTFRSSLVKVDGFSSAKEFENFVNQANIKANLLLKQRDPKRFDYKYRKRAGDSTALGEKDNSFVKQT